MGVSSIAHAGKLVVNSIHSDPTARKAFDLVVEKFKAENKDVEVTVNVIDHESYKIQIRTWLPNNPPDVATWFAGNRAKFFVEKGLVEPIDDVWKPVEGEFGEGAKQAVTFSGKKYLMPVNYYHWGFYYRKDLFEKAGVKKAPATWAEFGEAVDKLKASGVTPVAIGTKQAWPSAAWFDLLNMRVNGYDFHMSLLSGNESYADAKVKKAMGLWGDLVRKGAFPKNAAAMTWQEASALLWQGKAAMYLMGNFISTEIPKNLAGKVDFFAFPTVDPSVASAQVAPTDVVFIPAKAKNKVDARKFVAFMARSDVQQEYNRATGLLPPNTKANIDASNPFLVKGQAVLGEAKGLSQFFDRDAEPEVAKVGMDGFVEFMSYPDRLDRVLMKMDSARKRVHKK
jgi:multiple sugar transport system substrate-binding protein